LISSSFSLLLRLCFNHSKSLFHPSLILFIPSLNAAYSPSNLCFSSLAFFSLSSSSLFLDLCVETYDLYSSRSDVREDSAVRARVRVSSPVRSRRVSCRVKDSISMFNRSFVSFKSSALAVVCYQFLMKADI